MKKRFLSMLLVLVMVIGMIPFSALSASAESDTVIDTITITDVIKPVNGQTSVNTYTVVQSDKVDLANSVQGYGSTTTFVTGNTYAFYIVLQAKTGYSFASTVDITVNGLPVTGTVSGNYLVVTLSFTCEDSSTMIDLVEIAGGCGEGYTPSTNNLFVLNNAAYTLGEVTWYNNGNLFDGVFTAGQTYTAKIIVNVKSDAAFKNDVTAVVLGAKSTSVRFINQMQIEVSAEFFIEGKGSGTETDPYKVTTYKELIDLMRKSNTAYIKLAKDVTHSIAGGDSHELNCIEVVGTKYLDLNGFCLSRDDYYTDDTSMINVRGTLIINDSSADKDGKICSLGKTMSTAVRVTQSGSLVMNAGYISHETSLGANYSAITSLGDVTINGGEVYSANLAAIIISNGTCNIYGGTFTSGEGLGIWLLGGTTHIYGGYFGSTGSTGSTAITLDGEFSGMTPNLYIHNATCYGSFRAIQFDELEISNLIVSGNIYLLKSRTEPIPAIKTFLDDGSELYLDGTLSTAEKHEYSATKIEIRGEPKFTIQPIGGTVAEGEKLTVNWALNFAPAKFELRYFDNALEESIPTFIDASISSADFAPIAEDGSYYQILAYYNNTQYVASNKFYVYEIKTIVNTIELEVAKPVIGEAPTKPTIKSVNGDESLKDLVSFFNDAKVYWVEADSAEDIANGNKHPTVFADGKIYALHVAIQSTKEIAEDCVLNVYGTDGELLWSGNLSFSVPSDKTLVYTDAYLGNFKLELGDVNEDGEVTYLDMQRLYQHFSTDNKLTGDALAVADVNKDGSVTYLDMQRLYQHFSSDNKLS